MTIKVEKDKRHFARLVVPQAGRLAFSVRDKDGFRIPAKVTVLGKVGDFEKGRCVGKVALRCLYDPNMGESDIVTDFRHKKLQADTEYREAFQVSPKGTGVIVLRPGTYKVVASRGPEYELDVKKKVTVPPGGVTSLEFTLFHSVKTPKMISADLHVHTNLSHDSKVTDRDRLASFGAEGVEYVVATDHNRLRDLQPLVEAMGLERWVQTAIGVELTTFEMGHFNAFPLKLNIKEFHGGNPAWFKKDERYSDTITPKELMGFRKGIYPREIFNALRKRGSLSAEKTIVQVNHPRDSIFGYFQAYNLSADTGQPRPIVGLTKPLSQEFNPEHYDDKFEALEMFNGKRLDLLFHWRIPPGFSAPAGYGGKPGSIIRLYEKDKAEVAYPGGVDDWFNFLNCGRNYTGTANSDSHGFRVEMGCPRNYFLVGFDDPQQMTEALLSESILKFRNLMTNGPIIDFEAKDSLGNYQPVGSTIKASGGKVTLKIGIRAASWIDVTELAVYKNGRLLKRIPLEKRNPPPVDRYKEEHIFDVSDGDAWFVVTAKGQKDLWPVIRPEEIVPFEISTAVSLIQDSLLKSLPIQISLGESACLLPRKDRRIVPYAITNPIWVDTDKEPGYTPDPCRTLGEHGVRCTFKNTSCQKSCREPNRFCDAYCLDSSSSCQKDEDCGKNNRCIDGKCSMDPCAGIGCSEPFQACKTDKPCPNDDCSPENKRCQDGKSCTSDSDCAHISDDPRCRYCACPPPRKACDDGTPCQSDKECKEEKQTCKNRRFCYPTGCSLGYCVPTFPVCKGGESTSSSYLYLTRSVSNKGQLWRALPQRNKAPPLSSPILRPKNKEAFSIRNAQKYFRYFEKKK